MGSMVDRCLISRSCWISEMSVWTHRDKEGPWLSRWRLASICAHVWPPCCMLIPASYLLITHDLHSGCFHVLNNMKHNTDFDGQKSTRYHISYNQKGRFESWKVCSMVSKVKNRIWKSIKEIFIYPIISDASVFWLIMCGILNKLYNNYLKYR